MSPPNVSNKILGSENTSVTNVNRRPKTPGLETKDFITHHNSQEQWTSADVSWCSWPPDLRGMQVGWERACRPGGLHYRKEWWACIGNPKSFTMSSNHVFLCSKGRRYPPFLGCLSYKYLWKYSSKTVLLVLLTRHTETRVTHRAWSADTITHTALLHRELQRPGFAPDFDVWQRWGRGKDAESETCRSNVLDVTWRLWIPLVKSLHGVQTAAIDWLTWYQWLLLIECLMLFSQLVVSSWLFNCYFCTCAHLISLPKHAANQCILGG